MKKFLLMVFLMMLISPAMAWEYKPEGTSYAVQIPDNVPNFGKWIGPTHALYVSEQLRIYSHDGSNPDGIDGVSSLWVVEGLFGKSEGYLVGICYMKKIATFEGLTYYIDKSYWAGGPYTGKLEQVENEPSFEELVKSREKVKKELL